MKALVGAFNQEKALCLLHDCEESSDNLRFKLYTEDEFPENVTAATEQIPYMNLMPVYGLNVSSMIRHQTLVLTKRAVEVGVLLNIFSLLNACFRSCRG